MNTPTDNTHVLIVDDENLSAILSRALLRITGISHVYICNNPRNLMTTIAEMPHIDLVLLDLQLPGENGFHTLNRLHDLDQFKQKPFPIVAVTAQVLPEVVSQAQVAGF